MSTINKISNSTVQSIQRYMEVSMAAGSVGAVAGSNGGTGVGTPTSNPFPFFYAYDNVLRYKSGATEFRWTLRKKIFSHRLFHVDPSIISPSTLSFQSERINNVGLYERNHAAIDDENGKIEGDV